MQEKQRKKSKAFYWRQEQLAGNKNRQIRKTQWTGNRQEIDNRTQAIEKQKTQEKK